MRHLPEVRNLGRYQATKPPRVQQEKSLTSCPAAECGKEFEFEASETRVFEIPLPLFERRHFYRSELQETGR
jgi:hypothetical protein